MSKSRDLSSYGTAALADTGSGADNVITADASGNVGIGTDTADHSLQIERSDNQHLKLSRGSDSFELGVVSSNALTFSDGGTERMRIDTSGIVTMPYQPSFLAHATVDQALTDDNVIADFGGTTHNIGGHFSTSTGRFTAPVAGSYYFGAGVLIEGYSIDSYRITIRFRINGAETKNTIAGGGAHNTTHDDGEASVSGVMYLNANEYVDVKVSPTGVSGTGNIWGATTSSAWTNFNGHLIG